MHAEAMEWIERTVQKWPVLVGRPLTVLDVGGRDVNGTPRHLFPDAHYLVADLTLEPGVDVAWDATTRWPHEPAEFDVVISTETLEHVDGWKVALANMTELVRPGGRLLITAAAPPREPHSGIDGWELREGEHYGNVDPGELRRLADQLGLAGEVSHDPAHGDVYADLIRRQA